MCYIVFISHSLHWRYIKIALQEYVIKRFKGEWFQIKNARKSGRNQSKSIKFVTSRSGHVDGMNK